MSENRISSSELARSIGEILGRIRFRGESFVVERSGKPVAMLTPYAGPRRKALDEVLSSWLAAGEQDVELADLLDEVGRTDAPAENPWESR